MSTSSRSESITVVFYNTGEHGFLTPYQGGPLSVQISGTLKNGTIFNVFAPATDGALIESSGKSIKGDWKGTGSRFTGRNLDSRNPEYKVAINNPSLGIYGSLTLRSVCKTSSLFICAILLTTARFLLHATLVPSISLVFRKNLSPTFIGPICNQMRLQ